MRKVLVLSLIPLFLPGMASSDIVDEAAKAMCDCGVPPRSDCMNKLSKSYPEIDQSPELQDRVMDKYQHECVMGIGSKGGSEVNTPGMPAATGLSSDATDCSTSSFSVAVPKGWKCRKMGANPQDVTLYAYGNKLNVSLGLNQGQTSCSVIPVCKSKKHELNSKFESTQFINPMIGSHEYSGHYKKDGSVKLTITSNEELTATQIDEIKEILESFKKR
jgi:hypothetical protein